jgi:Putative Ig domain
VPVRGTSAVVLNLTATEASRSGYVTVWPSGSPRPRRPALRVAARRTVSNRIVVPLGADGEISMFNGTRSTVQLVADINGILSGGGRQDVAMAGVTPLTPTRLLDTRSGLGGINGPVVSDAPVLFPVAGRGGVPPAASSIPATAVVATVTVMAPTTDGSLTVFPTGIDRPAAADLHFRRGRTVSNLVVARLGSDGSLALAVSAGQAHVVVDVFGYASGDTFVSPQAAVLPSSQVTDVVGPADGIRTVTMPVGVTPPHVGQVVAVDVGPETPDGLLGQVEDVTTQGDSIVLTVAPATLDQAVPSGAIEFDLELGAEDVTGGGDNPQARPAAVRMTPLQPRELTIRAASQASSPIRQRIANNVSCQGGGSVSVDGDASLTASLHFDVRWGGIFDPGIKRASFTGDVTASAGLSAAARATAGCTLERTPLLRTPLRFRPLTFNVGPFVVVLIPELQLWLTANGQIRAEIVASATTSYTASAGLVWEDGRLRPVSSISERSSFQQPTPQASGRASASFGPTLDLLIYGAVGPTLNLTATLALNASTSETPWWQLVLTVDAGGGITIPALHFSRTRPDILHWSRVLARASTPPPPLPLEITTSALGGGVVGHPYSQTLHATGGRVPYRWAVIGDRLPVGLTLDPATGQIQGTPTTAETTNPRISVTDAAGAVADITLALTVVPPTTLADFDLHEDLSCDAHETGIAHSIYYGDSPRPACGTFTRVDGQVYGPALPASDVPGRRDYTPVELLPPSGGGSTPHVFSATVAAGDTGVQITETDRFTDGDTAWTTELRITSTGGTHTISIYRAGDCYIDDNDFSSGGEDPATGAVSCQDATHQLSYVPDSLAGVHHLEAFYADVWAAVGSPDPLPDTVRHDIHDSGLALQWQFTVDPTHPVTVTSRSILSISPVQAALAARTGTAVERAAVRAPKTAGARRGTRSAGRP